MNLMDVIKNAVTSSNPYKLPSEFDKKKQKEAEQAVKLDIISFSNIAKEMFQDERYGKLKDLFSNIIKTKMRLIIYYENPKQDEYNAKMREFQVELRTLMNILDTPQGFIGQAERILKETK